MLLATLAWRRDQKIAQVLDRNVSGLCRALSGRRAAGGQRLCCAAVRASVAFTRLRLSCPLLQSWPTCRCAESTERASPRPRRPRLSARAEQAGLCTATTLDLTARATPCIWSTLAARSGAKCSRPSRPTRSCWRTYSRWLRRLLLARSVASAAHTRCRRRLHRRSLSDCCTGPPQRARAAW